MTRKWSARLIALGGLMLAIGCRSTPDTPVITTPLLPETVVPGPPPTSIGPDLSFSPSLKPSILPHGARLPTNNEFIAPRLPTLPAPKTADPLPIAMPSSPVIVPPKDITPSLTSTPKPEVGALPSPSIKPLLIEAPRPPAGPDGFAPAPIISPPTVQETLPQPKIKNGQGDPPLPLRTGQRFGHAPDYKWIAGVLDRHSKGGYWTLRYADFGSDDEWGGKVRLFDDEHLNAFSNGDVIFLEGSLLAPRSAVSVEGSNYPPYRITNARLIEKSK